MQTKSKIIWYALFTLGGFTTLFSLNSVIYNNSSNNVIANSMFSFVALIILTLLYISIVNLLDTHAISKIIYLLLALIYVVTFSILPVTSDDILSYLSRGRIISMYKSNPYQVPYTEFRTDPYYKFLETDWSTNLATMGPLFAHISTIASLMLSYKPLVSVLVLKAFVGISFVLSSILIFKITGNHKATYLYAGNPLVIFEFLINSHHDSIMILFYLLGIYALSNKNAPSYLSGIFTSMSVLTKPFTAITTPFILLKLINHKKWKRLIIFIFSMIITAIVIYYPFLDGLNSFQIYEKTSKIISLQSSPFILLMSHIISIMGKSISYSLVISSQMGKLIFLVSYLLLLIYVRDKITTTKDIVLYSAVSIGLFLCFFLNWFMPWYVTILIAILSLYSGFEKNNSKINTIIYGVTFYGIINYLILG